MRLKPNRYSSLIYWVSIAGFFSFQIVNTLLFSGSFEELSLRNVDDNAMQISIGNMHEDFLALNYRNTLFKFDYAYGWIFWFTYSMVSFPVFILYKFQILSSESLIIVTNRFLTVAIAFLLLIVLRLIFFKLIKILSLKNLEVKYSELIVNSILVFTLLTPVFGYWTGRVQPNLLSALFMCLGFYFLLTQLLRSKNGLTAKQLTIFALFVGGSVAAKPIAVIWLPMILLCYLFLNGTEPRRLFSWSRIKEFSLATILIFFFTGILSSPSILFDPTGTLSRELSVFKYFSETTSGVFNEPRILLDRLVNGFYQPTYGKLFFIFITVLFILNLVINRKSSGWLISASVFLYTLAMGVLLSFYGPIFSLLIGSYMICGLAFITTALLLVLIRLTSGPLLIGSLILLLSAALLNFVDQLDSKGDESKMSINSYLVEYQEQDTALGFSEISKLQLLVDPKPFDIIVQSYRTPTVHSPMYSDIQTIYVFDNWNKLSPELNINWLILPFAELVDFKSSIGFDGAQRGETEISPMSLDPMSFELGNNRCIKIGDTSVNLVFQCFSPGSK